MAASGGSVKIERQISLPFDQAFKIALRNITIRLGRAMITGAGTMLGIAFLMSVLMAKLILEASGQEILEAQQQKNTWLSAMSLLVSVVGITNSMLMSVTERYKEIGTMKCLGALDNFIVKLFLLESAMLGFFGSIFGSLIGTVFVLLTSLRQRLPEGFPGAGDLVLAHLNWAGVITNILWCLLIGTVLSIIGALGPAIRAARMQPVDAMRSEV